MSMTELNQRVRRLKSDKGQYMKIDINNRNFTYTFILPVMVMMGLLYVGDVWISIGVLMIVAAYTITLWLSEFAKGLHISAKIYALAALFFLLSFEFAIVPEGKSATKTAIYWFTAFAVLEIMILKVMRIEPRSPR